MFSLDWSPTVKPGAAHKSAPVQAVVVDAGALDAEVRRLQQLEEQKERAAQEKVEALEKQAAEAERKRQQEEQRLAEVKRKQEQEIRQQAEAERKRKLEQETRAKAAAEQKRKEEEAARKQAEAEQKRKEEEARKKAAAEQQRKEEEARKKAEAEAEQKRREEAARKQAEEELQGRLAAEQAAETAQRQSAMDRIINEYVGRIRDKVTRNWIQPPGSGSGLSCTVEVSLIPGGDVTSAKIVRSSGNAAFDRSVEAAVFRASPLPVPRDPEVMGQFRSLRFEFKPGSL